MLDEGHNPLPHLHSYPWHTPCKCAPGHKTNGLCNVHCYSSNILEAMKVEKPCGGVLQSNHPNWVPRLILDLCRIENCDFFDIYHHVCRSLWCTPCIHESKDNHFENTFSWNKNLTFRQRTLTWEIVPFFFLTKKLCFLASNHLAMYSQMLGNKSCRFEMISKDTVPSYSFTMQLKTAFLEGAHS